MSFVTLTSSPVTACLSFVTLTSVPTLLAARRELVREGSLKRGKSNFTDFSERYLFLLTDVLLVAQVRRTGMGGGV